MNIYVLAVLFLILFLLIVAPIIMYLLFGWKDRKEEIFSLFSDKAIYLYFKTFYPIREIRQIPDAPNEAHKEAFRREAYRDEFRRLYLRRYGKRTYIFPIFVLISIVLGAFVFILKNNTLLSLASDSSSTEAASRYPFLTVLGAFSGAYFFVVYDLIKRERTAHLSPFHLCQGALRIIIAIPLGFVFAAFLEARLAPVIGFLMGAFPIKELWRMMRYLARRSLKMGEEEKEKTPGLIELQGIDMSLAERFEIEGIVSIEQLAYSDPIDITLRTGLTFMFVIDIISQALGWVYLEKDIIIARRYSLRGALEIKGLFEETDYIGKDATKLRDKDVAWTTLNKLAEKLTYSPDVLERNLRSVVDDPRYKYLQKLWELIGRGIP